MIQYTVAIWTRQRLSGLRTAHFFREFRAHAPPEKFWRGKFSEMQFSKCPYAEIFDKQQKRGRNPLGLPLNPPLLYIGSIFARELSELPLGIRIQFYPYHVLRGVPPGDPRKYWSDFYHFSPQHIQDSGIKINLILEKINLLKAKACFSCCLESKYTEML